MNRSQEQNIAAGLNRPMSKWPTFTKVALIEMTAEVPVLSLQHG